MKTRILKNLILITASTLLASCAGKAPLTLGINDHQLSPCPSSPNCVSSFVAIQDSHYIKPIQSSLSLAEKHERIMAILIKQDNASITQNTPNYIRAEFSSSLFGFVDDVEWALDTHEVHMRSASRMGFSDFGVNRDRLEALRMAFEQHKPE